MNKDKLEAMDSKCTVTESRGNKKLKFPHSSGYVGIVVSIIIAIVVVVLCNLISYKYLEMYPISLYGPEAPSAAYQTLPSWNGVKNLDSPVNTIITGDSTTWSILTGPVSDELGGTTIRLRILPDGSLLMNSWLLNYYFSKFSELDNIIICVNSSGYEREHNVEFMTVCPLTWGYWNEFNTPVTWKDGEQVDLFISKYLPLYSSSDMLAYRLLHPSDLFPPQQKYIPSKSYTGGTTAPSVDWNNILNYRPSWYFGAFTPTDDSTTALNNMSELADKYGFQIYIVLGPEWEEGHSDPERQAKVNGLKEYLDQFTGDNVYIVLSNPLIFKADEMQNPNHLRPDAAAYFTEALLADIREINGAGN